MLKITKEDRTTLIQRIYEGKIDHLTLSQSHLIDDIILSTKKQGIIDCISNGFEDKREDSSTVPFDLIMTLTAAAKMKVHTSLTDVPTALTDHRTISELGYSMWDTERDIGKGLMNESTIRYFVGKYQPQELIASYNRTVQKHILPHLGISANIHMLDCTDIEVNYDNENYEGSGVTVEEIWKSPVGFGELSAQRYPIYKRTRGYSLGVLRGIGECQNGVEKTRKKCDNGRHEEREKMPALRLE